MGTRTSGERSGSSSRSSATYSRPSSTRSSGSSSSSVRLVLLVIRVRLEPLLEAVVQDQLIVVEVQKHRVVILQQVIVIPVLLPMALLVLLHAVILQLRQVAVALGVVIRAVVLLLDHHQVEVPLVVAVPEDKY